MPRLAPVTSTVSPEKSKRRDAISARHSLRVACEKPRQQARCGGCCRRARRSAVRDSFGDFAENSKKDAARSAMLLFGSPVVSHTLHPFADHPSTLVDVATSENIVV